MVGDHFEYDASARTWPPTPAASPTSASTSSAGAADRPPPTSRPSPPRWTGPGSDVRRRAGVVQDVAPGVARVEADQVTRLVDGVERLVAAHLAPHLDTVVEALDDRLRRRRHRHVGVRDVEDLVAEPVGLQAALHHLPQVAHVDVGEDVAPPQRRVGQERGEHLGVLVGLDDVVDPQPVDVRAGARLERARRHLVGDLGRRVGVLGDRRVLLVDRHVERLALALGEAHAVRRLRRGEDDLPDAEPGGGLEDVVGADRVGGVGRRVAGHQDRRDGGEVDDGVVRRLLVELQLVVGGQSGERGVDLPGVGEVDAEVGDARVLEGDEVGVGDVVALLGEVGRDVLAGLAAATGEEDAHESLPTGRVPTARARAGLVAARTMDP